MTTMPAQKPGKSEQVVETPDDFIQAVLIRLGISGFSLDVAASPDNTQAPLFYDEETNGLIQPWYTSGWAWCNPPYSSISPWVEKAWTEAQKGAHIVMLVPASTGSNWWRAHVDGKAYITFLNGRVTFVGHSSPYPKDLALLLYAPFLSGGSTVWRWRENQSHD